MDEEEMVRVLTEIIIQRLTAGEARPKLKLVAGTDVARQEAVASVKKQWPRPFVARRLAEAS